MPGFEDISRAHQVADSFKSPRYRLIDRLEHYVLGTQYKGRPNWWTSPDVPLAEREPCVVYPIARIARDSFVDLVLGEHRFPTIDIEGLDSETLRKAKRRSRFEAAAREALGAGLGTSSACAVVGKRGEREFIDTIPVKWCRPTFADDARTVVKLEIEYPFTVEERDPSDGKYKAHARLFRRVIDDQTDITYKPVELIDKATTPVWIVDKDRKIDHGLGFCPVIWWPAMRGACIEGRFDGHALHEHLLDSITALDLALSQRQNAAFLAGSPQWTEIGVTPGYMPTDAGRQMRVPATPDGGPLAKGQRPSEYYVGVGSTDGARKKGPGQVWQYPDPLTKVELHQLAAGALDALSKNARDLKLILCDALAYVPQDPDTMPLHGISGKALEALKEKQLSRCDYLRDDIGDGLLIPLIVMLCRVCGIAADLDEDAVTLTWPPYYTPNAEDRGKELGAEVQGTTVASTFIQSPTFDRVAKKRLARLVLDGASDEDLEAVESAIDDAADLEASQASQEVPPDGQAPAGLGQPPDGAPAPLTPPGDAGPSATPPPDGTPKGASGGNSPKAGGNVLPIMPKARAAQSAKAPKDPGGTGSALLAKSMAEHAAAGGPAGLQAAAAHIPTVAPDAHLRASGASTPAFNAGVASTVHALLAPDYPAKAIDWLRDPDLVESIEGPRLVPTAQIDTTNSGEWASSDDDISGYVDKIAEGKLKPIVLVNEPNDEKFMIVDGHHREQAYEKLGKPAMAYIVHLKTVGDSRVAAMHDSQGAGDGKLTSQQK